MWGKEIILEGSRWKIGTGEEVSAMGDTWIPRPSLFSFIDPPNVPVETVVAELKSGNGKWDENLVRNMFGLEDAEEILSIPTSDFGVKDIETFHVASL